MDNSSVDNSSAGKSSVSKSSVGASPIIVARRSPMCHPPIPLRGLWGLPHSLSFPASYSTLDPCFFAASSRCTSSYPSRIPIVATRPRTLCRPKFAFVVFPLCCSEASDACVSAKGCGYYHASSPFQPLFLRSAIRPYL